MRYTVLPLALLASRAVGTPHSPYSSWARSDMLPPLPTKWSGVSISSQDLYTSINGTVALPKKLIEQKGETSISAWIAIDAEGCSSAAIMGGIDMRETNGTMFFAAWGWFYGTSLPKENLLSLYKIPITEDSMLRALDLQPGDSVDLNIAFEEHSVSVSNQRNGVSAKHQFQLPGLQLCQHNIAWIIGRTDDADDAAGFDGGKFTFTDIAASTTQESSVSLKDAKSIQNSKPARCSLGPDSTTTVTCSTS